MNFPKLNNFRVGRFLAGVTLFVLPWTAEGQIVTQGSTGGNVSAPNTTGGMPAAPGGASSPYVVRHTPWFSSSVTRPEIGLTPSQYLQLNQNYQNSYAPYGGILGGYNDRISDQQRQKMAADAAGSFYRPFNARLGTAITDLQARQRYDQLYRQYQGYGAFVNPTVQQQLGLTPQQQARLSGYRQQWNEQMNLLNHGYGSGQTSTVREFNDATRMMRERIDNTLNADQRNTWQQMTGRPYQFPPDVYYSRGAAPNTVRTRSTTPQTNRSFDTNTNPGSLFPQSGAPGGNPGSLFPQ